MDTPLSLRNSYDSKGESQRWRPDTEARTGSVSRSSVQTISSTFVPPQQGSTTGCVGFKSNDMVCLPARVRWFGRIGRGADEDFESRDVWAARRGGIWPALEPGGAVCLFGALAPAAPHSEGARGWAFLAAMIARQSIVVVAAVFRSVAPRSDGKYRS